MDSNLGQVQLVMDIRTDELTSSTGDFVENPIDSETAFIGGTENADSIEGTDLSERIEGGAGNDSLVGGTGDDVLAGGSGADLLIGGGGKDIFYVGAGAREDTIADFEFGSDRIGLAGGLTLDELSFVGNNVQLGDTVLVTLTKIEAAELTAEDFTTI